MILKVNWFMVWLFGTILLMEMGQADWLSFHSLQLPILVTATRLIKVAFGHSLFAEQLGFP